MCSRQEQNTFKSGLINEGDYDLKPDIEHVPYKNKVHDALNLGKQKYMTENKPMGRITGYNYDVDYRTISLKKNEKLHLNTGDNSGFSLWTIVYSICLS